MPSDLFVQCSSNQTELLGEWLRRTARCHVGECHKRVQLSKGQMRPVIAGAMSRASPFPAPCPADLGTVIRQRIVVWVGFKFCVHDPIPSSLHRSRGGGGGGGG
jgi:hypothetical protein